MRLIDQVFKHLEGPASVNVMKQTCVIVYSCIFYFIPTKFALKTLLKDLKICFLTLDLSKQNDVSCKLLNVITSS